MADVALHLQVITYFRLIGRYTHGLLFAWHATAAQVNRFTWENLCGESRKSSKANSEVIQIKTVTTVTKLISLPMKHLIIDRNDDQAMFS